MMFQTLRRGFSMLELIFVIVILGVVSSIGAEIIANVYEQYIIQRAQHRASIKTELAATQIANRLAHAIPGTVIRRSTPTGAFENINDATLTDHNILQWVGADIDSFNAVSNPPAPLLPGWSGFCDVDDSNTSSISTLGSNLALTNTIRGNLGLTSNPQIYFPAQQGLMSYQATLQPAVNRIGLSNYIVPPSGAPARIVEHYKLATSSYALEARANGDLFLWYNFAPQRGVNIGGNPPVRLLRNVSTFQMRGDGRTIRFKICVDEPISADTNITICKEKAVF